MPLAKVGAGLDPEGRLEEGEIGKENDGRETSMQGMVLWEAIQDGSCISEVL